MDILTYAGNNVISNSCIHELKCVVQARYNDADRNRFHACSASKGGAEAQTRVQKYAEVSGYLTGLSEHIGEQP